MINLSHIAIGTELLKGRIVNTNSTQAGLILRKYGFQLSRILCIPDTEEAILNALRDELSKSEVVLISGGLGPTKDDITKHTLAKWSQSELIWHEPTLENLERRFAQRGRALNRLTRDQALVPASCEVVPNHQGTAPGMCFRKENQLVFSTPGVPFEMLHMLEYEIVPILQKSYALGAFYHQVFRLADIPESKAAERMESIEAQLASEIDIAYLPRADGLWLELSVQSAEGESVEAISYLEEAGKKVAVLFEDKIYAIGERPLAGLIIDHLRSQQLSLSIAEDTSGGLIAAKLLEVSDIKDVLSGAVSQISPSYLSQLGLSRNFLTNGSLEEPQVQMLAEHVRKYYDSDIGLVTLGNAEKQEDQAASIWIGYADKHEKKAYHANLLYDRHININRAAHYAMQFCLKIAKQHFA